MRKMRDSGIKSFGVIPEDWTVQKLKALLFLRNEKNTGNRELLSVYPNKGVIFYENSSGMQVHKPSADLSNYQNVYPGDFVLNNQQAWRGSVGVSQYNGIISPAYFVFSMNKNCDPKYMDFALRDGSMVQQYETASRGVGTIQRNIFAPWLLQCLIALPPLSEQRRIASFLDAKCAEIDTLIADIQTQIDTLEQYKRSIITEAVTKGLNPNAEMKDSGIEWVGEIPENWEIMPNKYIMHKEKFICPIYQNEDILSLTMNGVIVRDLDAGGKMPKTFDGYQKICKGNLLMCLFDIDVTPRCIGIINRNGLTSPAYSQFVLHSNAVANYYYYYYLMLDFTKELLHMAKNLRHSLTEEQLGAIQVPVPPVSEQNAIADYLDTKCAEIDEIISQKREQISTIEEYKKSLIFEYVTGKKEVRSDDESVE